MTLTARENKPSTRQDEEMMIEALKKRVANARCVRYKKYNKHVEKFTRRVWEYKKIV